MQSEAVLIANPYLSEEKLAILDELLFRMEAVQQAEGKKNTCCSTCPPSTWTR